MVAALLAKPCTRPEPALPTPAALTARCRAAKATRRMYLEQQDT